MLIRDTNKLSNFANNRNFSKTSASGYGIKVQDLNTNQGSQVLNPEQQKTLPKIVKENKLLTRGEDESQTYSLCPLSAMISSL